MAKDGKVAAGFNPDNWRITAFLGPYLCQVADDVIEALQAASGVILY